MIFRMIPLGRNFLEKFLSCVSPLTMPKVDHTFLEHWNIGTKPRFCFINHALALFQAFGNLGTNFAGAWNKLRAASSTPLCRTGIARNWRRKKSSKIDAVTKRAGWAWRRVTGRGRTKAPRPFDRGA
jgi:hypothetical protein